LKAMILSSFARQPGPEGRRLGALVCEARHSASKPGLSNATVPSAHEPEVFGADFLTAQVRRPEAIQAVRPPVDELARGHQVLLVHGSPDPSVGPPKASEDLPEPETPVMTTSSPSGTSRKSRPSPRRASCCRCGEGIRPGCGGREGSWSRRRPGRHGGFRRHREAPVSASSPAEADQRVSARR